FISRRGRCATGSRRRSRSWVLATGRTPSASRLGAAGSDPTWRPMQGGGGHVPEDGWPQDCPTRREGENNGTPHFRLATSGTVSTVTQERDPVSPGGDTRGVEVVEWLLETDPAIRWQVMRDLTDAPVDVVAAERVRVATEGWGARLLALQDPDGQWG